MALNLFGSFFQIWPPLLGIWFIAIAIVHIAFAIGVASDASEYSARHGRRTAIVGSFFWMIATLVGGVFVAAIYWLIHRSTLSPVAKQESLTIS